ncbi:hypothetical protein ACLM5J_05735 [Nocardioides sp. Bht2]|uniref:hypothetical protein n=1 Tax=Nocardioides sp. Bht2 TaxID=3392297 RepID=UPI0039B4C9FE
MRRRGAWWAALMIVAGSVMTACGDDGSSTGGGGDPAAAEQRLEEQRDAVRELALQVAPALADSVSGTLTFLRGSWAGCTSADQWTYRNFKYRVAGRIDATGLSADSLTTLQGVLRDEGFEVSTPEADGEPGADGVRKELAAGLRIYPDDSFALVSFAGSCVDVPEGDREAWGSRSEPDKNLVPPAASSPAE